MLILFGQKLGQFQNHISNWTEVEAVIHGFKALADTADVDCQYIPAIMDMILTNIPYAAYPKQVRKQKSQFALAVSNKLIDYFVR